MSTTTYSGTAIADYYWGLPGHEYIFGYGGDDYLNGGAGDDIIVGNEGDDTLIGGWGDDQLYGADGDDSLGIGKGTDKVYGHDGTDTVFIDSGYHTGQGSTDDGWWIDLDAGFAVQFIGNVFGDDPDSEVNSAELYSIENASGFHGDDTILGNDGDNVLYDGDALWNGHDTLDGGAGDDTLISAGGSDRMDGGAGDDRLEVQAGRNHEMTGGAGADTFIFKDAVYGDQFFATIMDFDYREDDKIEMNADIAVSYTGAFAASGPSLWYEQTGDTATVHVDEDGDQDADFHFDVVMEIGHFIPSLDIDFV